MKKLLACTSVAFLLAIFSGMATGANLSDLSGASVNFPTQQDSLKIRKLLSNYTQSVSSGDRKLFESQLLDFNIPFAAVGVEMDKSENIGLKSVQDYRGFRKAIFDSGNHFKQRFSNIKIEQVGNLAQVSLDYETSLRGHDYAGKGWKVIQLIKFNDQWKIVSEFFTEYANKAK